MKITFFPKWLIVLKALWLYNVTMKLRFTVDECMNNDMVVHDLSKPLNDCLIKSVSAPGSHKSPFQLSALAMNLHQNMLPKDLAYYKPIKMPKRQNIKII